MARTESRVFGALFQRSPRTFGKSFEKEYLV